MSLSGLKLGTVATRSAAPLKISTETASDEFAKADEQKILELHQEKYQRPSNSNKKKASSALPATLSLAGAAGVGLMLFGHSILGFCAVSAIALYGVFNLSSKS